MMHPFSMTGWNKTLRLILIMSLFFFAPLSTALKSIPLAWLLINTVVSEGFYPKIFEVMKKPWCITALSLFVVAILACHWGPAGWQHKLSYLKKYNKLLYLPILSLSFYSHQSRLFAVSAFLAAASLSALVSISLYWGFFRYSDLYYDAVFLNHIMTGLMFSFAAFLTLFYAARTSGLLRMLHLILFLLISYQVLFVSLGRTGYFLYAVILLFYVITHLSRRRLLLSLGLIALSLSIVYTLSPTMRHGITKASANYIHFDKNKNTSVGYRLQFHRYAYKLLKRHPFIGNGLASFPTLFKQENPVPAFGKTINEPHSMYWHVASELGLLGVSLLIGFFLSLWYATLFLSEFKRPAQVLLILFALVNCSDSLLLYSATGYFFVMFMAVFISEGLRAEPAENQSFEIPLSSKALA